MFICLNCFKILLCWLMDFGVSLSVWGKDILDSFFIMFLLGLFLLVLLDFFLFFLGLGIGYMIFSDRVVMMFIFLSLFFFKSEVCVMRCFLGFGWVCVGNFLRFITVKVLVNLDMWFFIFLFFLMIWVIVVLNFLFVLFCVSMKVCSVFFMEFLEDECVWYGGGYDLTGCAGGWFSDFQLSFVWLCYFELYDSEKWVYDFWYMFKVL